MTAKIILIIISISSALAQDNSGEISKADSLYNNGLWERALDSYKNLSAQHPEIGRYHFRKGVCYHKLNEYSKAVVEYKKAIEIGNNPVVMYSLAGAYSLLGNKEETYSWLDKSIASGFIDYRGMEKNEDFSSLKNEDRFKELLLKAKTAAEPCTASEEYRQFDFWIGEWIVTSGGQQVGTSSIQLILGSCVIFENWTDYTGNQGKSFNIYNQSTKKWQQTWVDAQGTITEFIDGEYKDSKMQFMTRNITLPEVTTDMRRLTFFNLSKNTVRQFSEVSKDSGITWKTQYDFLYTRKN